MTKPSCITCDYFPACPGCAFHENVDLPPIAIELRKTFSFPIHQKELIHWRTRAKLAVRGDAKIGLFKRGTHEVIDISDCPLHHPAIRAAIPLLKSLIISCGISSYHEETQRGILRYIQFVVERTTGKIQLTLVVRQQKNLDKFLAALQQQDIWHSIWINIQPDSTNRIFGDAWHLIQGPDYLYESLGGNKIAFHPACFGQAHLSLFDDMLTAFAQHILPDQRVVEFYAGVGVIGLGVASVSKSVTCVEINPFAKPAFLKSTHHDNVSYLESATEDALYLLDQADVVIVDPPRKGLEPKFIQALSQSPAKQFIYMSCGPASFLRDYELLRQAGWALSKLDGYLLFPGTNHIEMLGFFERL